MLDSLNGLGSFLLLVVGFGLVIFVHELGHFVAAKSVGIKVLRFAIGFGPGGVRVAPGHRLPRRVDRRHVPSPRHQPPCRGGSRRLGHGALAG
jgi:hypothetical protein